MMDPASKEAAMRSALLLSVALGCAAFALRPRRRPKPERKRL
jgi:hypothetical protein